MPKVSILTPCYNVKEEWLSQCVESLLNQTLRDLEFIFIDDGSTDDTRKRLSKYANNDRRVKLICKKNSGYGDSMNMGLSCCTGEYVGIVEPDDWVEPNMFEKLYTTANDNDLDLVRCCFYEHRLGCTPTAITDDWIQKGVVLKPLNDFSIFLQAPGICISLARRDMLERNAIRFLPTPGASYQDMSYGFKLKTCAQRFMCIGDCLHHYRINETSSVSHVNSEQKAYAVMQEFNEIYDFAIRHKECFSSLKDNLPTIEKSCYLWNIDRLGTKFRYEFVKKWQSELLQRIDEGQVDISCIMPIEDRPFFERIAYAADEWFDERYPGERVIPKSNFQGKVSVIITMYKNEDTIRATIESVASQSYKNLEIICVDDVSPDKSYAIAKELASKDCRIRIVRRAKNGGLSACRNSGIDVASGEAVIFVDGDDELLPNAIERLVSKFDNTTDAVFSSCRIEYVGGENLYGHYPESDGKYYAIPGDDVRKFYRHEIFLRHCSAWGKLFRLRSINREKLRFPEGMLFEDSPFTWSYFSVYNNKVAFLREPVCLYRRRNGSIMVNLLEHQENRAIQHMWVLRKYLTFLRDRGLLEKFALHLPPAVESIFWFSFNQCAKFERVLVVAELERMLREFKIATKTNTLAAIAEGEISFLFPSPPPPPSVQVITVEDKRFEHRIIRLALKVDNFTRKIFPPGETRIRKFAQRVWGVGAKAYHILRGK